MLENLKTSKKTNNNLISDKTFGDLYPIYLSSVEDVSIHTLPISIRTTNRLMHSGIQTIADLCRMKVDDFIKLRGAGKKCYDETCKYLSELSNKAAESNPTNSKQKITNYIPDIISNNIDKILNQDFSFCDELNTSTEDLMIVKKYKTAMEILGTDFARICYNTPDKILPLIDAFDQLIKVQQECEYRKRSIAEHLAAIPISRRKNNVLGYINAFTNDEEQHENLFNIYSLDIYPNATIENLAFDKIAESVTNYTLLSETKLKR